MTLVEHCGVQYDESTDWRDFVQALVAGRNPSGLHVAGRHDSYSIVDEIGMLLEALEGTPMKAALGAAALDALEIALASRDERALSVLRVLPFDLAPGAVARMTRVLETRLHELPMEWVVRLVSRSLLIEPHNARVLEILDVALRELPQHPGILDLAAAHITERLAAHLPELQLDPATPRALWALLAPLESRQTLLTAIARLGGAHAQAFIDEVLDPEFPEERRQELLAELRTNSLFATKVDR